MMLQWFSKPIQAHHKAQDTNSSLFLHAPHHSISSPLTYPQATPPFPPHSPRLLPPSLQTPSSPPLFPSPLLGSYFYVIGISYDKTHVTCIWVNSSRFKMIITSGYIEDMKITQELLKKSWICRSWYLLDTCRSIEVYWSWIPISIYRAYEIPDVACNVFIPKGYLFMGLHNPYRTRKVHGLCKLNWNRSAYSKGSLSSYLNKEVKKENPNPRKFHKIFFLKP